MSSEIDMLLEIEREAEKRILDARAEAEKIIADAKRRAGELIREAESIEFRDIEAEYLDRIRVEKEKVIAEYNSMAKELRDKSRDKFSEAVNMVYKWLLEGGVE